MSDIFEEYDETHNIKVPEEQLEHEEKNPDKIVEDVIELTKPKKTRKPRKPMTPEQKERNIENLKKARERSAEIRKEKALLKNVDKELKSVEKKKQTKQYLEDNKDIVDKVNKKKKTSRTRIEILEDELALLKAQSVKKALVIEKPLSPIKEEPKPQVKQPQEKQPQVKQPQEKKPQEKKPQVKQPPKEYIHSTYKKDPLAFLYKL